MGATLIDDSYNANPASMRAAIDTLQLQPSPRWLVVGDMKELGSEGPTLHHGIGAYARERGIERLYAVGDRDGGYRVVSIAPRSVVLAGPRGRVTLRLDPQEDRP